MIVTVKRSPRATKKWRATLPSHGGGTVTVVDFGQAGASDFTKHKDVGRMLRYLVRHAGAVPPSLAALAGDPRLNPRNAAFDRPLYERTVARAREAVTASARERWADARTPGFWSRWLLWSHPDRDEALRWITRTFFTSPAPSA